MPEIHKYYLDKQKRDKKMIFYTLCLGVAAGIVFLARCCWLELLTMIHEQPLP